jgi:hypothetical protein
VLTSASWNQAPDLRRDTTLEAEPARLGHDRGRHLVQVRVPQLHRRRADVDLETRPSRRFLGVPVEVLVRQGDRRGPVGDLGCFLLLALLYPGSPLVPPGQQALIGVANSL